MDLNNIKLKNYQITNVYSHSKSITAFEISQTNENFKNRIVDEFGFKKAVMIFYLDYKVLFGKIDQNEFSIQNNENFESGYVKECRIFNETQELYLWKVKKLIQGRIRRDSESFEEELSKEMVIDSYPVILGTDVIIQNGFTKLSEMRGSEIYLPFEIDRNLLDDHEKLGHDRKMRIQMRNYLKYDERHYLGCYDSRFVKFLSNKEEVNQLDSE